MNKENKNPKNILLSYPRSGNHLTRFFIELLSELPTYGCCYRDIEIYKNKFDEHIPFNIPEHFDKKDCYFKYHDAKRFRKKNNVNKLILILRNPRESFGRQNFDKFKYYEYYFDNIDFYNNHKGKKLLLYYEDILTNKEEFINTLYDFLDVNNLEKKNYVLSNIDKLFQLCLNGKNRFWKGNNSHGNIDFYYKKIGAEFKERIDGYINDKIKKYPFLSEKYNIDKM